MSMKQLSSIWHVSITSLSEALTLKIVTLEYSFAKSYLNTTSPLTFPKRLEKEPDFFDIFDEPPLYAAFTPMSISSGESSAPVLGILEIILRHQGDPNVKLTSPSVSDAAMGHICARSHFSFQHAIGPYHVSHSTI